MNKINIEIFKIFDDVVIPVKKTSGSIGFDINVRLDYISNAITEIDKINNTTKKYIILKPLESMIFNTGLKFKIPENYAGIGHVRSSTGIKRNLLLSNGTIVLDSDYRGELFVALFNRGHNPVPVFHNSSLIQMLVVPNYDINFNIVDVLEETERGEGGIGSTDEN